MIRRHPHIYGETNVEDTDQVVKNWEDIKLKEGKKSVGGSSNSLPALVKAYRIQEKVSGVGFDWDKKEAVLEKVKEELDELRTEIDAGDSKKKGGRTWRCYVFIGQNYARFLRVNPENALERTNKKFIRRFKYIEEKALKSQRKVSELSNEEMRFYGRRLKKLNDLIFISPFSSQSRGSLPQPEYF